ncbi:MAG: TolC family protein [Vicinamibacterales bacterium]
MNGSREGCRIPSQRPRGSAALTVALACFTSAAAVGTVCAQSAVASPPLKVGAVVARSAPARPSAKPANQPPAAAVQAPTQPDIATVFPPLAPFRLPPRVGVSNEVVLSLADAVRLAMESNPRLKAVEVDRDATRFKLQGARGVYDPTLTVDGVFQKAIVPAANSLSGSTSGSLENRMWKGGAGISGLLPSLGGRYAFSGSAEKDRTTNVYALLDPSYPSVVTAEYRQPLWGNVRYSAPKHAVEVARRSQDVSRLEFRRQVMDTVQDVEQAYWELSFAWRNLDVQVEALGVAREQYETNRRQATAGQLAPIEVVAAQTQLAGFESNVYAAQDALTRAENALKQLMLPGRGAALWASALHPVTPPDTGDATPDLMRAVETALAERPEIAQREVAAQINRADQKLSREQLKPQLDLSARYARAGLAGDTVTAGANPLAESIAPALVRLNELSALAGQPPVSLGANTPAPNTLVGGLRQSLDRLWAGDFPTSMVALSFSVPLGNGAAKASLGAALAEGRRIALEQQAAEQSIEAEIRDALQSVVSARERLAAAGQRERAAGQEYQSEARRFARGASTLFLVQQKQLAMVAATSLLRRAEADVSEAVSQLARAQGNNYKRHDITLTEDAGDSRSSR